MKNTKRALLLSALAIVMSVAMLIGSTFAWFTDSASTAVNTIQSGTLKVELEMLVDEANDVWETAEGKTLAWKKAAGAPANEAVLWEPGCTYELPKLRVRNAGNLALKYQIVVTGFKGDAKLLEVIDFELPTATNNYKGLAAGASDAFVIKGTMDKDAGNEYQGLTIDNIAITVYATQLEAEYDSLNNTYDAMATVDTEEELLAAIAGDYDAIALGGNIVLTNGIVIPAGKTLTIDLMGFSISQAKAQTAAYAMIDNKGNLTIQDTAGAGKISYEDTTVYTADNTYASNTIKNTGVLKIEGGTVENVSSANVMDYGFPHAIDVYPGSETIVNGGTVKSLNYDSIRMFCNSVTDPTKVVINGGTIINRVSFQDPHSTNPGYGILEINGGKFITTEGITANVRLLNFCANCNNMKATVTGGTFDKGFKTQDIGGSGITTSGWLSFGAATPVTTLAELQAAIDNATDGAVIKLAANITGDVKVTQKANTKITIDGNKQTFAGSIIIDGKSATILTAGLTIKNVNFDASSITEDASINMGKKGDDNTRYVTNLTVEDCTFTGTYPSAEKVGIKTYTGGGENLTVKGCVATNMHSLAQIHNIVNVEFAGCDVVGCKNGISVGSSRNVKITDCDIDAVAYGIRGDGGETDSALTITDCDITAHIPVVIRKVSKGYALTVNGTNTMTETNTEGLWCVAAYNEYGDVDKAGLTAVEAAVTITVNDNGLDQNGIFVKN